MKRFFIRPANRFMVFFEDHGYVPVAESKDDQVEFLTPPPRKLGDESLIRAEGQVRMVMLKRSSGHVKNDTYLVDMGA